MIPVTYQCRKCLDEFPVEVVLGESNDLPETCPACGEPIPMAAQLDVEESAISKAEMANDDE